MRYSSAETGANNASPAISSISGGIPSRTRLLGDVAPARDGVFVMEVRRGLWIGLTIALAAGTGALVAAKTPVVRTPVPTAAQKPGAPPAGAAPRSTYARTPAEALPLASGYFGGQVWATHRVTRFASVQTTVGKALGLLAPNRMGFAPAQDEAWAFEAGGTFQALGLGGGVAPPSFGAVWALVVAGQPGVLGGHGPTFVDLGGLGAVTTLPASDAGR